jgi:hypothetical protein
MPLIEDRPRPSSTAMAVRCTTAPTAAVPAIGGTGRSGRRESDHCTPGPATRCRALSGGRSVRTSGVRVGGSAQAGTYDEVVQGGDGCRVGVVGQRGGVACGFEFGA